VWRTIQARRKVIWEFYDRHLREWGAGHGISCPTIPAHVEQAYHMYYILLQSLEERQRLIAHLKENGILGVFHYLPLHLSVMGRRFGGKPGDCPVTEDISDRLLRLPFYNDLDEATQERVVAAIKEFAGTTKRIEQKATKKTKNGRTPLPPVPAGRGRG
jgi:dTDP-4-amino-4,6-dideoxygalactose transaminase